MTRDLKMVVLMKQQIQVNVSRKMHPGQRLWSQVWLGSVVTLLILISFATRTLQIEGAEMPPEGRDKVYGSGGAELTGAPAPQPKLPKINIYINKSEIRKLLGIDTRINYVTNGNINTYPLSFTIPLGYNQSDIIFTWQNLGQTNVNYSISLIIGNIHAVEAPLINITRSGLIPRHEQVFKITLPCSGRVTDEVDVQVLINVAGYLTDDEPAAGPPPEPAPAELTTTDAPMQADQAEQARPRLVTHTLAIKRKKICTIHPVQMPVQPRPPARVEPAPANRWPQVHSQTTEETPARPAAPTAEQQWESPPAPAHISTRLVPPEPDQDLRRAEPPQLPARSPPTRRPDPPAYPAWPQRVANWPAPLPSPIAPENPLNEIVANRQQQQAAGNPLVLASVGLALLVALALLFVGLLGSGRRLTPLDKLAKLTGSLLGRTPAGSKPKSKSSKCNPTNVMGSFRAGQKSSASSLSGLSAVSGQSQPKAAAAATYCYKSNQCAGFLPSGYHHYQQPPTADLLGTGYQCQPGPAPAPPLPPQYPIYHIANGTPGQATRLIWNNGHGLSPDRYPLDASYLPLSNGPRSDSGSVYQTIY